MRFDLQGNLYVGYVDGKPKAVLPFGTYGNRDSTAGLPGDLVPAGAP